MSPTTMLETGAHHTRESRESDIATVTRATFSLDNDSSPDTKRSHRSKESNFSYKYGHRHHSYDPEKAPYPLSYDKEVLGLDLLDHGFIQQVNENVSYVDWKDEPPTNVLDLGCGSGAWVIDAARQWPDSNFVGFDLVNIQPPASYMDRSITDRVRWVHGNFLTTKLPFEDDTFEFVRVKGIAKGVPENKWTVLYAEINRVLCPGGIMESIEEDIIFPTLPRWFTSPLRLRPRPTGSPPPPPPPSAQRNCLQHEHALLESLFYSIFESRFINCRPTAITPAFAASVFHYVRAAPILEMKMPPLAPLTRSSELRASPSPPPPLPPGVASLIAPSSSSLSTSSSDGCSPVDPGFSSILDRDEDKSSRGTTSPISSVETVNNSDQPAKQTPRQSNIGYAESTCLGFTGKSASSSFSNLIIPMQKLASLDPETMATQLYHAYEGVLACQEAMWEQLKDRVRNKPQELKALGWDDEELVEFQGRKKFETLIKRYRDDMHYRVALWHSLIRLGWALPPQGPLTRAEVIEGERLRQAMLDARKFALEDDMQTPCRSIRMMVGIKAAG